MKLIFPPQWINRQINEQEDPYIWQDNAPCRLCCVCDLLFCYVCTVRVRRPITWTQRAALGWRCRSTTSSLMHSGYHCSPCTTHLCCLQALPCSRLILLCSFVCTTSKRILTLGLKEEPSPRPKTLQLQKMVRYSATLFVQVSDTLNTQRNCTRFVVLVLCRFF